MVKVGDFFNKWLSSIWTFNIKFNEEKNMFKGGLGISEISLTFTTYFFMPAFP
jgi:hypothetical protein